MTWHIVGNQLDEYLSGTLDGPTAASVEAHLLACTNCRERLSRRTPSAEISTSWQAIERRVDSPPVTPLGRVLDRVGLKEHQRRLLAPTAPLRSAWLGAITAAVTSGALLARGRPSGSSLSTLVFLMIATTVPLAAVAGALSSASEPAPEVAAASPLSAARLSLLRVTVVLVVTVTITFIAGLLVPGPWTGAALWLLPSLAMCSLTTAMSGRLGPVPAAAAVGASWVFGVSVWVAATHDRMAPFHIGPQIAYLAVTSLVGAALLWHPELIEQQRSTVAPSVRRSTQ